MVLFVAQLVCNDAIGGPNIICRALCNTIPFSRRTALDSRGKTFAGIFCTMVGNDNRLPFCSSLRASLGFKR
jgi:hypothetical protein